MDGLLVVRQLSVVGPSGYAAYAVNHTFSWTHSIERPYNGRGTLHVRCSWLLVLAYVGIPSCSTMVHTPLTIGVLVQHPGWQMLCKRVGVGSVHGAMRKKRPHHVALALWQADVCYGKAADSGPCTSDVLEAFRTYKWTPLQNRSMRRRRGNKRTGSARLASVPSWPDASRLRRTCACLIISSMLDNIKLICSQEMPA